jgi:hypothetical protein
MISVIIYSEHLAGDTLIAAIPPGTLRARRNIGVNAGADVPQKTFVVDLNLKPEPVEVWRIFYYLDDQQLPPEVPADQLKPVTGG